MNTKMIPKFCKLALRGVNLITCFTGLAMCLTGFNFYSKFILPLGMDDDEAMMLQALLVGIFGTIIFIVATAGVYGLHCDSKRFKVSYLGLLVFLTFATITLRGILPDLEKSLDESMLFEYKRYFKSPSSKKIVDACQRENKCCGYLSIRDFNHQRFLPETCCSPVSVKKYGACYEHSAYSDTCKKKLSTLVVTYFTWLNSLCLIMTCVLVSLVITLFTSLCIFPDHKFPDSKDIYSKMK